MSSPYRSMQTHNIEAVMREVRVLRHLLRFLLAFFIAAAAVAFFIAMAATSLRAEVGIAVFFTLLTAVAVAGRSFVSAMLDLASARPAEPTPAVRIETASEEKPSPAAPNTVAAMRTAIDNINNSLWLAPTDPDLLAQRQLLIASLHELETTGRLTQKR